VLATRHRTILSEHFSSVPCMGSVHTTPHHTTSVLVFSLCHTKNKKDVKMSKKCRKKHDIMNHVNAYEVRQTGVAQEQ
jgi:hypothetical protein